MPFTLIHTLNSTSEEKFFLDNYMDFLNHRIAQTYTYPYERYTHYPYDHI
jgi:hypothetical protein